MSVATTAANVTAYSDTGLPASTTYYYRVKAATSTGDSEWSNTVSAKTLASASTPRTLTLRSANPASGASIILTTDKNGQGDAATPATRSYNAGKAVILVAAQTAGGNTFQKWQRDGVDLPASSTVAYVTMDADCTLTAVYGSASGTRTFTSLAISGPATVNEGGTGVYTATAAFSDGSSTSVAPQSWSLSPSGSPASISPSGVLDAGAVNADTAITTQASYSAGGVTRTASKAVTIINSSATQTFELSLTSPNGFISRTPNQNQFPSGAQVVLRAIQGTNYRFTGWGGDAASFGTANPITVTMNGNKNVTANFVYDNLYFGPVTVTLTPAGAAAAGAQWRLGNGPWQNSGATVMPDSNGSNNLFFSNVPGYIAPPNRPITIVSGQSNPFNATYVSQLSPGSLQVALQPEAVIASGAQWRPAGTQAWQNNGATVTLDAGVYALEFKSVSGWSVPTSQSITVNDGRTAFATAVYGPAAGTPAIFSTLPANGPLGGGTSVTLTGANFTPPVAVYFDGVASIAVNVISSTQITAVAPPRTSGGTVPVQVTTAGGEATRESGFTYGPKLGEKMQLELSLGGSVTAVDVLESRAYINQGPTLVVFDVSNPANPVPLGRFTVPYTINDIAVYRAADNRLYATLAANDGGLLVVDATNPASMLLKGSLPIGAQQAWDVALLGGLAYLTAGDDGLLIIDLANPAKPVVRGKIADLGYATNVLVEAKPDALIAYVAGASDRQIHFVDVSVPEAPVHKGAFRHGYGWLSGVYGLAKKDDLLYVGLDRSAGVLVVNVSDFTAPALLRTLEGYAQAASAVFVRNNTLYSVRTGVGADIFDLSTPASPTRLVNFVPASVTGASRRAALQGNYLYIAGSESGLSIINMGNPASPTLAANFRQGTDFAKSVLVSGSQAVVYAGNLNRGVNIYSIDTLGTARFLTKFDTGDGGISGFAQNENLLFAAGGSNGMYILDVTSPGAPIFRGRFTPLQAFSGIGLHEGRPVVAGYKTDNSVSSLWVVDVSNPGSPTTYGATSAVAPVDVTVRGNRAYFAAERDGGLRVFDLSDPRNPREIGSVDTPGYAKAVAVSTDGLTAYVAEGDTGGSMPGGVLVVDVSGSTPVPLHTLLAGQTVNHISVNGQRLVVSRGGAGVSVVDITQPRNPVEIANFNTPGSALYSKMEGDRVYVADGYQGIAVLTLLDAIAPTVTITNPTFSPTYTATGGSLALGGSAMDDKALARIVWTNNRGGAGEAVGLESWTAGGIPLHPGANVLTVTAFDSSGNVGTDTLTVTFTPSDTAAPIVSITHPATASEIRAFTPSIELRGAAGDNVGVTGVTWSNNRGGSGTTSGTTTWTVGSIPLAEGPNRITLTATDAANNTGTATVTVTYTPRDVTAPVVTIAFPAIGASYVTSDRYLNLSGAASDERGVSAITWSNDRGGDGTASGTSVWSINDILLQPGLNILTVTVEDEAGNAATDILAVTFLTPQTINFTEIPTKPRGVIFTLAATTSSGLPVSFEIISGPATLGADGKTVTVGVIAGTVTIRAAQSGGTRNNIPHAPAESVEQIFQVTATPPTQSQTISFAQPTPRIYGDDPVQLIASASSGLPVGFELVSTAPAGIATLDDDTLTIRGAGKATIRATQPGAYPFKPAAAVTRTITINKADLAVSFDSVSRLVRAANPSFIPTYVGFVNGDTAADLAATRPVGKTSAVAGSPEGQYPLTFTGGLDANYRFVAGEPAFLTVEGFGGAYEALLVDGFGTPRGKLELTVPANALTYTGTLNLASEPASLSIRGSLSATDSASATGSWSRAANIEKDLSALALGFELADDNLDAELSVNNAPALSIGSGSRLFVQPLAAGKKQNAPWIGTHTLVLRDPAHIAETDERPLPLGAGHASTAIASTGVMTLKGKLADGTALTGTSPADATGHYRIYARPYAKRLDSFLSGELALVEHPDQTRFLGRYYVPEGEATLFWAKAKSPAKPLDVSYRLGFEAEVVTFLDPWIAPAAKAAVINGATIPAGTLAQRLDLADSATSASTVRVVSTLAEGYDFGSRAGAFPTSLTLSAKGVFSVGAPITTPVNVTAFSLTPTSSTGAITGSFVLRDQVLPPPAKPTDRKATFSGTLRQGPEGSDNSIGHAHFLVDPVPSDASTEQISGELQLFAP